MLGRAMGFGVAVLVAPLLAGSYSALAAASELDAVRLRSRLELASHWVAASAEPWPESTGFSQTFRIPLRIDGSASALPAEERVQVLHEINAIWAQAGICFDMRDVRLGLVHDDELVLRFIAGGHGLPVFGMFDGHKDMWTADVPALDPSPHPTQHPAARTAAHELGHALGLEHLDGRAESVDALMASGRRGYRLQPFEIVIARGTAQQIGVPDRECGQARVW